MNTSDLLEFCNKNSTGSFQFLISMFWSVDKTSIVSTCTGTLENLCDYNDAFGEDKWPAL